LRKSPKIKNDFSEIAKGGSGALGVIYEAVTFQAAAKELLTPSNRVDSFYIGNLIHSRE
jgi:hypothetical protein